MNIDVSLSKTREYRKRQGLTFKGPGQHSRRGEEIDIAIDTCCTGYLLYDLPVSISRHGKMLQTISPTPRCKSVEDY